MQGKNPPAEPGPAGGLRFRARDSTETLEISGRSRDLLYLCVITRSARRRAPPGAGCATARMGGLARPPARPPSLALPSRLLGNPPAADSRRQVAARGETAFPEALSAAVPGLGNTWDWGGLWEPRPDPRENKAAGRDTGKGGRMARGWFSSNLLSWMYWGGGVF